MLEIGICSYSFHRLLGAGRQDIFQYIRDCKELGCTQLDPWNYHLDLIRRNDEKIKDEHFMDAGRLLSDEELYYLEQVKAAADEVELPFGLIAADGAHIYEPESNKRALNRARAYRWLEVAERLGADQVRIDAGGPEDMPAEVFKIIQEGYRDVIDRAGEKGIEVLVENHWGPTVLPDNVIKLLENVPGLGLLLDTHNWKTGFRDEGRARCARYAKGLHIKTLHWDDDGNEVGENVEEAIRLLLEAGYHGIWGIESVPDDGDEHAGARKTIALIRRLVPVT